MFDGKGMIDNQLGWDHRVHLGRIPTAGGDGIPEAGEVNQGGLAQNVMTHNPGWIPGKIKIAFAFNQLQQCGIDEVWVATSNKIFSEDFRRIRQLAIATRYQRLNRRFCVEVV
jgi:hypothetical protein